MADTKYYGKYRAKVVDVDDPERRGRIRVQCPTVLGVYKSAWCEPCIPYATDFAGDYYVPPLDEAIWVEFEEGDANKPIWNGGWYKIDSSPLLKDSKPNDYRFISFKNTIIRMGDKEVVFEFRTGDTSSVFKLDSSNVLGLTYIGSKSEQELKDLDEIVNNKTLLLEDIPSAIKELQNSMNELQKNFGDFITNSYNTAMESISNNLTQINDFLTTVNDTFTQMDTSLNELSGNFKLVQDSINIDILPNLRSLDTRVTALETKGG